MTERSLNRVTVLSGMIRNCSSKLATHVAQVIGQMFALLSVGLQRGSLEFRLLLGHAFIALIRLQMHLRHCLHDRQNTSQQCHILIRT